MLKPIEKNKVTNILSKVVGTYSILRHDELGFYCPFCKHHKQKLQVNIETQKWHCWVCNSGGEKLSSLLRKTGADSDDIKTVKLIYKDKIVEKRYEETENTILFLPKEYKSLAIQPKSIDPEYKNAIHYLETRNIGINEIVKYNIGYCTEGNYAKRIIIPSYSADGTLNYFVSRAYYPSEKMSYKNPPTSKNVICFDSQINWNEPIILCEGVFDAIAIRRNAIPLLGKFPSKKLKEKIFQKKVKDIVIALDSDAMNEALKAADYFRKQGLHVKLIKPERKDASEMGYSNFHRNLNQATDFTSEEFILSKIINI